MFQFKVGLGNEKRDDERIKASEIEHKHNSYRNHEIRMSGYDLCCLSYQI